MNQDIFLYMFPGTMLMWLFFIAQTSMDDINQERMRKTLMRMASAPITLSQIVISKIARSFLLCYIIEAMLVVFTTVAFGIHWGNLVMLIVVTGACNLCITGVLAVIHALMKSKNAADAIIILFIMISSFLGGAFFPYQEMPPFLRDIGYWTIIRWGILCLQGVMEGDPVTKYAQELALLFSAGAVMTGLGFYLNTRRFERGGIV
ncbi:MAG: ABC transporter permease subunit [bacterium]|nr:ABC transporter permease subunit [bacterium]